MAPVVPIRPACKPSWSSKGCQGAYWECCKPHSDTCLACWLLLCQLCRLANPFSCPIWFGTAPGTAADSLQMHSRHGSSGCSELCIAPVAGCSVLQHYEVQDEAAVKSLTECTGWPLWLGLLRTSAPCCDLFVDLCELKSSMPHSKPNQARRRQRSHAQQGDTRV